MFLTPQSRERGIYLHAKLNKYGENVGLHRLNISKHILAMVVFLLGNLIGLGISFAVMNL